MTGFLVPNRFVIIDVDEAYAFLEYHFVKDGITELVLIQQYLDNLNDVDVISLYIKELGLDAEGIEVFGHEDVDFPEKPIPEWEHILCPLCGRLFEDLTQNTEHIEGCHEDFMITHVEYDIDFLIVPIFSMDVYLASQQHMSSEDVFDSEREEWEDEHLGAWVDNMGFVNHGLQRVLPWESRYPGPRITGPVCPISR